MNVAISIPRGGALDHLTRMLGPEGRQELNTAMGYAVQELTVDYLRALAATRHTTAEKLGAAPTNHLAQAADKVAEPSALESTAEAATLTINHPGMTRAFRDVTIRPKEAKALAIPVHALAYGRQPAEIWDSMGLFATKGAIYMHQASGEPLRLYVLVRSVTQKQDRTLLPSGESLIDAAKRGALSLIDSL